jgi:hypothetical protein
MSRAAHGLATAVHAVSADRNATSASPAIDVGDVAKRETRRIVTYKGEQECVASRSEERRQG